MSLIQRIPWRQQPQIAVGIDWNNPISRGLKSAVNGGAFNFADLVDANAFVGSNSGKAIIKNGVALNFNGSSDFLSKTIAAPPAYTTLCIVRTNTGSGVNNIMSAGAGGAYAWQIRQDSNQLSFYHESGGAPQLASESGVMTAGSEHIIVGTWDGASTTKLYRAGALRSSNTNVASIRSVTSLVIGRESNVVQYWNGGIALCATWFRELSAKEVFDVSNNPWLLFPPLPRRIWAPVSAGGGAYTITAAAGSYALAGKAAAVLKTRILSAAAGSYSLTGNAASVIKGRVLSASAGSYAVTGKAASIARRRVLSASAGSYAYTGKSATIAYAPATGAYTLTAAAGSYAVTGASAAIRRTRVLSAAAGAYTFAGKSANIIYSGAPPVKPLRPYFDVLSGRLLILRGAAA
jgi:hypothetical protein